MRLIRGNGYDRSEMGTLTRRRALLGVAGALAALAGCDTTIDVEGDSMSNDPRDYENVEKDPEYVTLRNPEPEQIAWLAPEGTETTDRDENRQMDRPEHGLVADRDTADRLRYADGVDADRADQFVADTDFESETLLLEPRHVGECYETKLCYLTWSSNRYHTWYLRTYRPVEVACETDDEDLLLHVIRIPDALDPEDVTGSGGGMNTQSCWGRRLRERTGATGSTGTPTTNGTETTDGGEQ